jgi:hypothetical protein
MAKILAIACMALCVLAIAFSLAIYLETKDVFSRKKDT